MPILNKLGLGRTPSAPAVPTDDPATSMTLGAGAAQKAEKTSPLRYSVDATEGDEYKTEVDDSEVLLLSDEPGEVEGVWEETKEMVHPVDAKSKAKLSLDIPASVRTPIKPPSSYRPARDTPDGYVLRELEENDDELQGLATPKSASSGQRGVWLCSKPQMSSPSSPVDENGNRRRSIGRPLVVRAMSTGRLATEFDDEGRIISLSSHCERVLKARAVKPLPPPVEEGEELRRSVSVADAVSPTRKSFNRSQTANNLGSLVAHRRRSVESGFRRLENIGSWSKRGVMTGDMSR